MDKINIRATKLEAYRTCPYRYKFEPPLDDTAESLRFGSALHKYVELRLSWMLNATTEWMILNEWGVKQRLMILKMANLIEDKVKEKWYILVCSERTNKLFFEDVNIGLEWTFDHLFINQAWDYILMDVKTTKAKRTQDHKDGVRQNVIYPALLQWKYGILVKYFEYWACTKTSNPILEDICFEITGEPMTEVHDKLVELRKSTEAQTFAPNYPNFSCWYCKLYDSCKQYKKLI